MSRHEWVVMAPFEVTDEDARRMATGEGLPTVDVVPATQLAADERPAPEDARPFFGLHNLRQDLMGVVCWSCEEPWTPEVAAKPCAGQPAGKLAYVDDEGRDRNPDEVMTHATRPGEAARHVGVGGVGRNDPCPCGSGLKFKRCHGA